MEEQVFNEFMMKSINKYSLNIDKNQLHQYYLYMNLLLNWNEKMNLTAITEPTEIIIKHFIDSLTVALYINEKTKVLDIGTGAGFPGIPLKIYNPNIELTLVDSLNKRLIFLEEVIKELNLNNIYTIHARAEELGKNEKYREKYDIVVSRAVANLEILSEYMLPFVKIGGKCICMKGPNIEEELTNSKAIIKKLGGKIEKIEEINLENNTIKRNLIIIKKINETPAMYPRRMDKIKKDISKK